MGRRKSPAATEGSSATCCNCGHAFMATPCPGRNFIERPRRCPMTRGWIPISAMFEPIGDTERQQIIDEELRRIKP